MKTASVFYALALLTLPAGSACKMLLGLPDMLWIDPTLIFAALAFVALAPDWREADLSGMSGATAAVTALTLLCVACAAFGSFLRPPAELYDVLREPERLVLTMIWLLTSCWFLRVRPAFVVKYAAIAAVLGLIAGLYIYLVAFGLIPASGTALAYSRRYMILQAIWYNGMLLPRMGGFFVEAPPFGLFMLALGIVFWVAYRAGIRSKMLLAAAIISAIGVIVSFAGQALLGACICVPAMVLSSRTRRAWVKPLVLAVTIGILTIAAWQTLIEKGVSAATGTATSNISQNSVGERNFHLNYGLSLLEREPLAVVMGIGPGRYGEYAADTGYFPSTATMQFSFPEILVEWGVIGLGIWLIILTAVALHVRKVHAVAGVCLLIGLLVADSFQANWKSEAVLLAIAVLCTPASVLSGKRKGNSTIGSVHTVQRAGTRA